MNNSFGITEQKFNVKHFIYRDRLEKEKKDQFILLMNLVEFFVVIVIVRDVITRK